MKISNPRVVVAEARPGAQGCDPWSVFWIYPDRTVVRSFASEEEAFQAARAMGRNGGNQTHVVPHFRQFLSTKVIMAWMDVADDLLTSALAKGGS